MNPASDESAKPLAVGLLKGKRPIVPKQIIREYTYAYTAASPQDGTSVSLILPDMRTECLNIFLKELSDRHPNEHITL